MGRKQLTIRNQQGDILWRSTGEFVAPIAPLDKNGDPMRVVSVDKQQHSVIVTVDNNR